MERIIQKLRLLKNNEYRKENKVFDHWTSDEKKKLLELYLLISQNEHHIFSMIYKHHECDSWEDIFCNYDPKYLQDKANGVQLAIDEMKQQKTIQNIRSFI